MESKKIKIIFVEIDNCLISTKSGRKYPLHSEDWMINFKIIDLLNKLQKQSDKDIKIILCEDGRKLLKGFYTQKSIYNKVNIICKKVELLTNRKKNTVCYNIDIRNEKYYQIPNTGSILEDLLEYELNPKDCLFIVGSFDFIELSKNCNINYIIL